MEINNIFRINDWEIKKFLILVISIQIALWGILIIESKGIHIPLFRELVGFIYLTFLPGFLIMRILKIHDLDSVNSVLYSVGLSISFLMVVGFLMNLIYPFFGYAQPIALNSLIVTFSVLMILLCLLSYIIDKKHSEKVSIELNGIFSPLLFLVLIPFLAIIGTYLVNFYNNNLVLLIMIILISLLVILIGFGKFIPKKLYPLSILVISLSLLFHTSLISIYMTGADINIEYYFSNVVLLSGHWNPSLDIGYGNTILNGMLSVVMVLPIYQLITNVDLAFILKVISPFLFSLAPLGLFSIIQKQTNYKIAFFSSFFIVSTYFFIVGMPALPRQGVAELFLVLTLMLLITKDVYPTVRSILILVFTLSMIFSHYALSYLYLLILLLVLAIFYSGNIISYLKSKKIMNYDLVRRSFNYLSKIIPSESEDKITITYILFALIAALAWYMFMANSTIFNSLVHFASQIVGSLYSDFLDPNKAQGMGLIMSQTNTPLHTINKIIYYANQILIIIGFLLYFKYKDMKINTQYGVFSTACFLILFAGILVPFFAGVFSMERIYHVTLFFLSPFFVLGLVYILKFFNRLIKRNKLQSITLFKIISIYLVIIFLFNVGFVYYVFEGYSSSISISQEEIKSYGTTKAQADLYATLFIDQDVYGAKWLSRYRNNSTKTYADISHSKLLFSSYGMMMNQNCLQNTTKEIRGGYVFLGYYNIHYGLMNDFGKYYNMSIIQSVFDNKNIIYSNGGSIIFAGSKG